MKLIHVIRLDSIGMSLEKMEIMCPQFVLVSSGEYLKIYKQVR